MPVWYWFLNASMPQPPHPQRRATLCHSSASWIATYIHNWAWEQNNNPQHHWLQWERHREHIIVEPWERQHYSLSRESSHLCCSEAASVKKDCLKCKTYVGCSFSLGIWDVCYCIQWKKEHGHQSERERLKCKVIFTLRIMAHVFSRSLSTGWLYCVAKNDVKSRQEWKRRYSWETDIKDAGESICGPRLDENGVEVTVLDVQTGMWCK